MTSDKALEKKIGAIEKEVATVKVVIKRAGRTRLALLVAVLLLIGIAIWSFYSLAMEFRSEENMKLFAEKAKARAESSREEAQRQLEGLAKTAVPVLQEAFTAQVEKDRSKFQTALENEGETLKKNLETELNKKIKAQIEQMSKKYEAILRDEFPDLEDPELLDQMFASVEDIVVRLGEEYYSEGIQDQIEGMGDKWLEFDMAEEPKEGDPTLEVQFMASLLHLAAMKIDEKSVE